MSKLQEYLKRKRIQDSGLPKIYIVESTSDNVEKPVEKQVVDIIKNVTFRIEGKEMIPSDRYKLEDSPYEVDILRGETSSKSDGYSTGVGDLWAWSIFASLSLDEAHEYYQQELTRIK